MRARIALDNHRARAEYNLTFRCAFESVDWMLGKTDVSRRFFARETRLCAARVFRRLYTVR